MVADLVMDVRAGTPPARPEKPDRAPDLDLFATAHGNLSEMRVTRHQSVAVIDLDHPPVAAATAGEHHLAVGGGRHRLLVRPGHVHAVMPRGPAVERIRPNTELAGKDRKSTRLN